MNPEKKLLVILLSGITGHLSLNALEVQGRTSSGMNFKGEVVSLHQGVLELGSTSGEDRPPLGVPLSALKSVQFSLPDEPDPEFTDTLEMLVPVLPYCDTSTLSSILKWIRQLEEIGKWPDVYLWASRVLSSATDPAVLLEARLTEARSLMEMGLYNRLESRLELINAQTEPMEASPRLCKLNARLCEWKGDSERARFWSELPRLQIPAKPGINH